MGAFYFGFFMLGYYIRSKKPEEGIKLDKDNAEFVAQLNKWKNYGG